MYYKNKDSVSERKNATSLRNFKTIRQNISKYEDSTKKALKKATLHLKQEGK